MESLGSAIILFILFMLVSGLFHGIALHHQFFTIPKDENERAFSGRAIAYVLIAFILLSKLLPVLIFQLFSNHHRIVGFLFSEPIAKMLSYSISSLLTIYLVYLIGYSQDRQTLIQMIGFKKETALSSIRSGFLTFLLAITAVTAFGILLQLLTFWVFGKSGNEQSIITFLKQHTDSTGVKILGFFNIVIFAPTLEELIFRGFIQRYFRSFLDLKKTIIATSVLFALVHFSLDQGLGNIALLGCIFVLSLYLGFAYEKTKSILAPITLHMLFNFDGIIQIFFTGS
jgi:membrane protease YdiL (CAAX protease family)